MLSKPQKETIASYLLGWDLEVREFFDELFDHYCFLVEERMTAGENFQNAHTEVSYLFSEEQYMGFYGPKAMEQRFVANRTGFRAFFKFIPSFIKSVWLPAWVCLMLALWYFRSADNFSYILFGIWFLFIGVLGVRSKWMDKRLKSGKGEVLSFALNDQLKSLASRSFAKHYLFLGPFVFNLSSEGQFMLAFKLIMLLLYFPLFIWHNVQFNKPAI